MLLDAYYQAVTYFLHQKNIPFEFKERSETPFPIIYIREQNLCIHLISIAQFQAAQLPKLFFQQLSEDFSVHQSRLIHLWEDVWYAKTQVVKSRLLALLGRSTRIHARLCQVQRIDKPTVDKFLTSNHLQVITNAKFKYGIFIKPSYFSRYQQILISHHSANRPPIPTPHSSSLVAAATFSAARTVHREGQPYRSVELIRFANLRGCTVVGGLDKLLKAFINEHHPDDIMTYADRDWSDGRGYEKVGFQRVEVTPPQTFLLDIQNQIRHYPKRLHDIPSDWISIENAGNLKYLLDLRKK